MEGVQDELRCVAACEQEAAASGEPPLYPTAEETRQGALDAKTKELRTLVGDPAVQPQRRARPWRAVSELQKPTRAMSAHERLAIGCG